GPFLARQPAPVVDEHLYGDVIRTGVEVRAHSAGDRVDVPPYADRVDQPVVAAVDEVRVVEAETLEIAGVVGQPQVRRRVPPRDLPRGRRVGREHAYLLGHQQLVRSEDLARPRRVLGRDEVRV